MKNRGNLKQLSEFYVFLIFTDFISVYDSSISKFILVSYIKI